MLITSLLNEGAVIKMASLAQGPAEVGNGVLAKVDKYLTI
jgi:hypothetical protein